MALSTPRSPLTRRAPLLSALLFLACQSRPEVNDDSWGDGDGDGDGTGGISSGDGDIVPPGDGDATGGLGGGDGDDGKPCSNLYCPSEQHCDALDGTEKCVPNTCNDLACDDDEECVTTDMGALCESLNCEQDVECASSRYCDKSEGRCIDDVCVPGTRSCSATGEAGQSGADVYICTSNGGDFEKETGCGSAAHFESSCTDLGAGQVGCSCEDDWDCPGHQECEAGICQGSLLPPQCRLPAAELKDVLPTQELVWGTDFGGVDQGRLRILDGKVVPLSGEETGEAGEPAPATLSPWSDSPQATQVPIVANLDDDNGDGLINERDVAEILFLTFTNNSRPNNNGILRALHGGGTDETGATKKGRDYLAVCGDSRWVQGKYYGATGEELASAPACGAAADLDPASTLAVGDLNYDGIPEIVAFSESRPGASGPGVQDDGFYPTTGRVIIYDNVGRQLLRTDLLDFENAEPGTSVAGNPGISLANVIPAASGEPEIAEIVIGRDLFTLAVVDGTWSMVQRFQGQSFTGDNFQGPVSCVADLIPGRPGMEIVAGSVVYGYPLVDGAPDTTSDVLVTLSENELGNGFCAIADVWGSDPIAAPGPANPLDGTAEIVVIRADEALDEDVLFVYALTATEPEGDEDWIVTLEELAAIALPDDGDPNPGGGPPNIDDFDGDGFPEIGTAGALGYLLFDLQVPDDESCPAWVDFDDNQQSLPRSPPSGSCASDDECNEDPDPANWAFACNENANVGAGSCVCLHNSWSQRTQDGSSEVTGSSVFDFNGDGSAEVIYNDECHFRMYSGIDGQEAFLEPSEGRTRIEYPIVADIDNDGNAEIVFATSTESGYCNAVGNSVECTEDADCPSGTAEKGQRCIKADPEDEEGICQIPNPSEIFNAGIEVWGDLTDRWVSARRIWNQYSYHVTNVTESGGIPAIEPNSWQPLGDRLYNTYRSQPRSFGSAPDLLVDTLQVIEPGSCGASKNLVIAVQVKNAGDLRVGNVPVTFVGRWEDAGITEPLTDADGVALTHIITQTLEPGAFVVFQVEYDKANNGRGSYPSEVTVIVDPATESMPEGLARECKEDNNTESESVNAQDPLPDLRLVLNDPGDECPPAITGTVYNDSQVDVEDVVVRLYRGDPSTGAQALGDLKIDSIRGGESVTFDTTDEKFHFDGAIPTTAPIRLFGDVDPEDTITECNESNNRFGPTAPTDCEELK